MNNQSYVPGVCNINKEEIAYRKKAMWLGTGLTVVLLAAMILLQLPYLLRVVLFVPIFIAVIGYLQTKNKFCVAYGASGKQNASEGSKSAEAVAEKKAIAADKKKAQSMNFQALIISIVVTGVLIIIPNATY